MSTTVIEGVVGKDVTVNSTKVEGSAFFEVVEVDR